MPNRKLLISIKELEQVFERLPVSGHPEDKQVMDVKLDDGSAVYLDFVWDYPNEQWQMNATNLIVTTTKSL